MSQFDRVDVYDKATIWKEQTNSKVTIYAHTDELSLSLSFFKIIILGGILAFIYGREGNNM